MNSNYSRAEGSRPSTWTQDDSKTDSQRRYPVPSNVLDDTRFQELEDTATTPDDSDEEFGEDPEPGSSSFTVNTVPGGMTAAVPGLGGPLPGLHQIANKVSSVATGNPLDTMDDLFATMLTLLCSHVYGAEPARCVPRL